MSWSEAAEACRSCGRWLQSLCFIALRPVLLFALTSSRVRRRASGGSSLVAVCPPTTFCVLDIYPTPPCRRASNRAPYHPSVPALLSATTLRSRRGAFQTPGGNCSAAKAATRRDGWRQGCCRKKIPRTKKHGHGAVAVVTPRRAAGLVLQFAAAMIQLLSMFHKLSLPSCGYIPPPRA